MSWLTVLWSMAGAVCFTLAAIHFGIWLQRRAAAAHLFFSLTAACFGFHALGDLVLIHETSLANYPIAIKLMSLPAVLGLAFLVWFVVVRFEARRRRFAWALTAGFSAIATVIVVLPYGMAYERIDAIRIIPVAWGDTFTVATGPAWRFRPVFDLLVLAFFAFVVHASRDLWRRGGRRRALWLGGSILFFFAVGNIQTTLVVYGALSTPRLAAFAFLAIVVAVGFELSQDVVRSEHLAREVDRLEQRRLALIERVRMLQIGMDRDGRVEYVNPFFTASTGIKPAEIVGRPFTDAAPPELREQYARAFAEGLAGGVPFVGESIVCGPGDTRLTVRWSNVVLTDPDGTVTGIVSIGADVTAERAAERARDEAFEKTAEALREVEALKGRLEDEVVYLKEEVESARGFDEILGRSNGLNYVLHRVEQVAPLETTVLIEGETGVGKELVARAIHARSRRASRPIVTLNCAALPRELVEAELFGHERGAFTGAERLRKGRFEVADRGTLFLDEIGELPIELQAKLLRVLQSGEFERIGSERTLRVDVRIIAATNRKLVEEVERGRFREDLFYRLSVFPLTVPPLRERRDDIPLIAAAFVDQFARAHGRSIERIPGAVMDELVRYDWPGNVRELRNVIERAVIALPDDGAFRLASRLTSRQPEARESVFDVGKGALGTLEEVERDHMVLALTAARWRIEGASGAALSLGLHPNTLRSRMRKLGIVRPS